MDREDVRYKRAKATSLSAARFDFATKSTRCHLGDENELVRYHLCTALVVVGCAHPTKLADAEEMLRARLTAENPSVRGRAAEALGLLAGPDEAIGSSSEFYEINTEDEETSSFLTGRVRFYRCRLADDPSESPPAEVGTNESVRDRTDDVAEAMTSPGGGECPHWGLSPPAGPGRRVRGVERQRDELRLA